VEEEVVIVGQLVEEVELEDILLHFQVEQK
jgi:hypothetical protein